MERTDPRILLATLDNLEESLHRVTQEIFGSIHGANQCQRHLREYAERLTQRIERMRNDIHKTQEFSDSMGDSPMRMTEHTACEEMAPHTAFNEPHSDRRRIAKAVKKWEGEVCRAEHRVSAAMLWVRQARNQHPSHSQRVSDELSCAKSELAAAQEDLALCESCFQTALRASDIYLPSAC